MKNLQMRFAALLLILCMIGASLAGCGQPTPTLSPAQPTSPDSSISSVSQTDSSPASDTRLFTDSLGRDVEIPADIQKFAPSGSLAQLVLYGLAPDRMVGWTSKPTDAMAKYFDAKYINLPTFGTFYGKNADLNVEALIAANPQVVIDVGEVKANMKESLDALQQQIGIPVVFVEAKLETMGAAYRTLGELLNLPEDAKKLADYCDNTIADAKKYAAAIPQEKRVKVYYGEGKTGLQTNPKGSFHAEVIDLVGGSNVADIPITSGSGGNEISMEQLLLWTPDVIILGPNSIYQSIGKDALWQDLTAVQQKKYFEIPNGPYNWMGRPPAVNRIIGVKWLGNLLYPEQFKYNMAEEVKTFYKLFYHYELTDVQSKELMANSTFAKQ